MRKKRVQRIETVKKKEMQTETICSLVERDLIYREMISMLKLKEAHKRALRARGLSDTDINVMIQTDTGVQTEKIHRQSQED